MFGIWSIYLRNNVFIKTEMGILNEMPTCPVTYIFIILRSGISRRIWDEKVTFDFQGRTAVGQRVVMGKACDDEVQPQRGLRRPNFFACFLLEILVNIREAIWNWPLARSLTQKASWLTHYFWGNPQSLLWANVNINFHSCAEGILVRMLL